MTDCKDYDEEKCISCTELGGIGAVGCYKPLEDEKKQKVSGLVERLVICGKKPCPDGSDGRRWYSLNVHYWDSNVVLGPVSGNPGGSHDVWATGADFAETVANAIRFIESKGHRVDNIGVNI